MRSNALVLMSALLICLVISNGPLIAQSKDRNNPTPLNSQVIKGFAGFDRSVHWYKLTAGPGELIVQMGVGCAEGYGYGTCNVGARFVLWDKNMKAVMDESLASSFVGGEGKTQSLILQNKQDFLLSIGHGSGRGVPGTYIIRFKGAIDLPPEESEEKDD